MPSCCSLKAVLLASLAAHTHAISSPSFTSKERVAFSSGGIIQWQELPQQSLARHNTDADRRRSLTQHKSYSYNDFWINEGCPTECAMGEFCGKDQGCHTFNCENVYAYGNPDGIFIRDESEDLTCADLAPGEPDRAFLSDLTYDFGNDIPTSVRFECTSEGSTGNETCPSVPMNRQCVARQDEGYYFQCYEIAPSTDLDAYFAEYITATVGLENVTNNETGIVSRHSYTVDVSYKETGLLVSGPVYEGGISSLEFNQTLASMAIRIIVADAIATPFPDCRDEGCLDNEFCGSDLKCHSWGDCESFYNYGPMEYTGHKQSDNPGLLECEVGAPPTDCEWPTVVEYVCNPFGGGVRFPGDVCTSGPDDRFDGDRFLGHAYMTRRCESIPNDDQSFECFDMNPSGTNFDEYFGEYLENIANATCPNYTTPEDYTTPLTAGHIYWSSFGNDSVTYNMGNFLGPRVVVLDADRTRYSIHARLEGERSPEGDESPEGEQSSAITVSKMWPCTVVGIVVATMASFYIL